MTDRVDHVQLDRWAFDAEVADVFDDMLERSIPAYDEMRAVTTRIAEHFLSGASPIVLDLGASRGEALVRLLDDHPDARAIAVEISEPMADAAERRLGGRASVQRLDLRESFPAVEDVDVILCVLTLQFIPIEHRHHVLADAYGALRSGGALVLVEKILGEDRIIDELLVAAYYDRKRLHGYSEEEITRKRLALEGVLVPVTASLDEALLDAAGFAHVERIWQSLNFAGWVAVK
jgi:tRNA (cmo5U34)-methyltransferase